MEYNKQNTKVVSSVSWRFYYKYGVCFIINDCSPNLQIFTASSSQLNTAIL